jgi:S-methylmethionine-dependent homocysteine/selenocysteine methylase
MARYRNALPQLNGGSFLTDGGLETTLVFLEGIDLPCFAAFPLAISDEGRATLERYFAPYLRTASDRGVGFVLDTPTWRANADWGAKLGYSREDLVRVQLASVALACDLRQRHGSQTQPIVVNGVVGPRGDGYRADLLMTAAEAQDYHSDQIGVFSGTEADMVSAITMNYAEEAIGIARAARAAGLPVAISFTVETDGKLPTGEELGAAITRTDAETASAPAYYMINCAHPTHFDTVLSGGAWQQRIRGIRANASTQSHAELDAATALDSGDPADLGRRYKELRTRLHGACVLGGCCGTDLRHIEAICEACF